MKVRRARADDLDTAAAALGAAFAEDPWVRWCVDADDHVARITTLQRLALELIGLPHGRVWMAEIDGVADGAAIGVAVWTDSTTEIDRSLLATLADRSRPLHGDRLHAAIVAEQNAWHRPEGRHFHLEAIGTRPEHWRCGLGSAVLRPELEFADAEGAVCSLETSTVGNTQFYESMGFEIVHHRVVPGGGPDVWTMWRQPDPGPQRSVGPL